MAAQFLAAFASKIGTPISDFLVGREQQKLQQSMQDYRNEITGISARLQENQTTLQEIDASNASRAADQQLQLLAMSDQANAEVSSAAAGVTGGSSDAVMRGLRRSALNAQRARIDSTDNAMQGLGQQRTNIALSEIFQTDNTVLPKPSFAALLLSVGQSAYSARKQTTPRKP
jgi:hypothetical protein